MIPCGRNLGGAHWWIRQPMMTEQFPRQISMSFGHSRQRVELPPACIGQRSRVCLKLITPLQKKVIK
jgi:hypothetical protein